MWYAENGALPWAKKIFLSPCDRAPPRGQIFFGFWGAEVTRLVVKLRAGCWAQDQLLAFKRGYASGFWDQAKKKSAETKAEIKAEHHMCIAHRRSMLCCALCFLVGEYSVE